MLKPTTKYLSSLECLLLHLNTTQRRKLILTAKECKQVQHIYEEKNLKVVLNFYTLAIAVRHISPCGFQWECAHHTYHLAQGETAHIARTGTEKKLTTILVFSYIFFSAGSKLLWTSFTKFIWLLVFVPDVFEAAYIHIRIWLAPRLLHFYVLYLYGITFATIWMQWNHSHFSDDGRQFAILYALEAICCCWSGAVMGLHANKCVWKPILILVECCICYREWEI